MVASILCVTLDMLFYANGFSHFAVDFEFSKV